MKRKNGQPPKIIGTVEAQTLKEAKFKAKHEFHNETIAEVNKKHTVYNVWGWWDF